MLCIVITIFKKINCFYSRCSENVKDKIVCLNFVKCDWSKPQYRQLHATHLQWHKELEFFQNVECSNGVRKEPASIGT